MGGTTQEKNTQFSQLQNTNFGANTSGNTSANTAANTTAQINPAFGSGSLLSSLLGQLGGVNTSLTPEEQSAIGAISSAGATGNQFAPALTDLTKSLLGGGGTNFQPIVSDAYSQYRDLLNPTASGKYLDPATNPFFGTTTQAITDNATKALKDIYSGAGRNPADAGADFTNALGKGVSTALAPVFASTYDTERGRQESAIRDLLSGGTGTANTLSNLQQTSIGNQLSGAGLTDAANAANLYGPQLSLLASSLGRSIPTSTISQLLGIASPVAQAFGTQTGSQTGSQTGAQYGTSSGYQLGNTTGQQNTQTSTPFNPLSLLPLAFAPLTGGTSLAGMGASALGSGLFGALTNGFSPGRY